MALQGSIWWRRPRAVPDSWAPLGAVTLTPRGRRLRGQGGSAALTCASGKGRRHSSCLHGHWDGKAASEVFRSAALQPGLPHKQRDLPFPQQLASEGCLCKFKWAQVPSPRSLDTVVPWEFRQPSPVLPAPRTEPSPEPLAMAQAGLGALRPGWQPSCAGYSQAWGHSGASGDLCLSQRVLVPVPAAEHCHGNSYSAASWSRCSLGSTLSTGFNPAPQHRVSRAALTAAAANRPGLGEGHAGADKAQARSRSKLREICQETPSLHTRVKTHRTEEHMLVLGTAFVLLINSIKP